MANVASVLKEEFARVARKALKAELDALRKASAGYRRDLAALKRQVAALERGRKSTEKQLRQNLPVAGTEDVEAEGARRGPRFSVEGLKTLRARLDLSAAAMAKLLNVSAQSVYNWEQGKATPQRRQLQELAALRGLGKREVAARLEALQ
jgi:DNA-binding transcriptional regulator YiaG